MAPVEERFWFLHESSPGSPICNETILLRLRGRLDAAALRRGLDGLVERHAPLRTRYGREGAEFVARTEAPCPCPLEHVDLSAAADPDAALERRARAAATRPFDLAAPPLIRAVLLKLWDDDHAVLVTVHHIAADGGSFLRVIPNELARAHAGLPPVPLTSAYDDFVQSQRTLLDRRDEELAWWRAHLEGAPTILSLPTDRPHPPRPTTRGERIDRVLETGFSARIAAVAAQLDVRSHHVMLAAWAVLLARYSEQDEVLIGMPIANRAPGFEDLIGCFINNLVLRIAAPDDGARTFADVAHAARREMREARAHGDLPFGEILDRLEVERDPSRSPVYQAMFNYLPFSVADAAFEGLEVDGRRVSAGIAMMDLSLDVTEERSRHRLTLEYSADVLDRSHAMRMIDHYQWVLEQALDAPDRPLGSIELVPALERELIDVLARGPTLPARSGPETFHGLVFAAGAQHPTLIAAQLGRRALSYSGLEVGARRLARRLCAAGVGPGDRVGLSVADPLDALTSLLGIMTAGAAYVPLDPSTPDARLADILRDVGAKVLVADRGHELDDGPELWAPRGEAPDDVALPEVDPESIAYVIYTSGSTGRPKGVEVRHRNVAWQCAARRARYDDPPGTLLAIYSFGFDSSIAGITWTLLSGGTLHFLGPTERQDPRVVRDAIAQHGITHLDAVPSMYGAVLDAADAAARLSSLRVVICGGEALPAAVVKRHFERLPRARLYNEYGPTEATVFATVHELTAGETSARVSIGAPVGDVECRVLDARGRLAPLGHPGELFIGGGGVAKGYLDRPELTRERFVERPEGRAYRTGDRCRTRDDGALELLRRTDDQVQVRGFRVEPGEVEEALRQVPGIAEAAVMLRGDDAPRLVGYVVTKGDRAFDPSDLRSRLAEVLPAYMVPAAFVEVGAIPLTSRGKVDKKKLPDLSFDGRADTAHEPPRDPLEASIARFFEELLDVSSVGRHDGFFVLGGHSLLAVRLLERIERAHGARLPLAEVFRSPTVAKLAALARGDAAANELATLETMRAVGARAPLFFVGNTNQARLLMPLLDPEQPVYGLNVFGLPQREDGPMTIEWIADRYLADLRAARPHGPYTLGGYCIDAKIALEMAHRLTDEGEVVEALVIVDGVWFLDDRGPPNSVVTKVRRLRRNLRDLGPAIVLHKLQRRIEYGGQDLRQRVARLEQRVRGLFTTEVPLELEQRVLLTDYFEALEAYQHRPFPGRTVVIVAEEWQTGDVRLSSGEDLEVRPIPGHHETIFEGEQLVELGRLVRAALEPRDG